MRAKTMVGTPDPYNDEGSAAMMPCHVEFSSMLDGRMPKTVGSHSRSSSLSSSESDVIDFLIEGIDIQDKYDSEENYSKEEGYISPYSCGKTFIIHKQSKDETLGIELGKATKYGGVFVTFIEPTSKFAYTGLKPGMQILSINDRPCPVDFRTVAHIMKQTVGDLKISAIDSTNKKVMAMAIQKRKAPRQQKRKQKQKGAQIESSQSQATDSTKKEQSSRSAKTWSPGSHSNTFHQETRESQDTGDVLSEEERCDTPSSTPSKMASPRALASGGARLLAHWILSKRYQKIKGNHSGSPFGGSSRRRSRRSLLSAWEERRIEPDEDECSKEGLLKKIPSALALDDIVEEGLEPSPTSKELKLSNAAVSKISKEYYEANGMVEI